MARARPLRRLLVQERKSAGRRVDGKRADDPCLPALKIAKLADRIQELAIGVNGKERGIGRLRHHLSRAEAAAGQIQLGPVDPFAASPRVGADVDADGASLRCLRVRGGTARYKAHVSGQNRQETNMLPDHHFLMGTRCVQPPSENTDHDHGQALIAHIPVYHRYMGGGSLTKRLTCCRNLVGL